MKERKNKGRWVRILVNTVLVAGILILGWKIADYLIQSKKSADFSENLWEQVMVPSAKKTDGAGTAPALTVRPENTDEMLTPAVPETVENPAEAAGSVSGQTPTEPVLPENDSSKNEQPAADELYEKTEKQNDTVLIQARTEPDGTENGDVVEKQTVAPASEAAEESAESVAVEARTEPDEKKDADVADEQTVAAASETAEEFAESVTVEARTEPDETEDADVTDEQTVIAASEGQDEPTEKAPAQARTEMAVTGSIPQTEEPAPQTTESSSTTVSSWNTEKTEGKAASGTRAWSDTDTAGDSAEEMIPVAFSATSEIPVGETASGSADLSDSAETVLQTVEEEPPVSAETGSAGTTSASNSPEKANSQNSDVRTTDQETKMIPEENNRAGAAFTPVPPEGTDAVAPAARAMKPEASEATVSQTAEAGLTETSVTQYVEAEMMEPSVSQILEPDSKENPPSWTDAPEQTETPKPTAVPTPRFTEDPSVPEEINFEPLWAISKNAAAWLYSPDTGMSQVVAYTDNNTYYLYHLLDGTGNSGGTLFIDCRNSGDFSDRNTIIYGHSMHNKSMFGRLIEYEDAEYCKAHRILYLYVPGHRFRLEVVAAFGAKSTSEFYTLPVRWKQWEFMLEKAMEKTAWDFGIPFDENDHFVTLSTCAYEVHMARYIVIARIDDPEGILDSPSP